ncbi:MAG: PfkB family carbohydrate kinase [Clostridia bacterium]
MKRARLLELMKGFPSLRVAVMGDLFLDRWLTVDPALDEPSVETGLTAWQVVESLSCAGAAGTVLNNLSELGIGKLYAIGLLGMDGEGYEVKRALEKRGVDLSLLVCSEQVVTPAYVKPMFLQKNGTLLEGNRMDIKNRCKTPEALQKALLEKLYEAAEQVDAIVVLDQLADEDTGVVTAMVRKALAELGKTHKELLIYADSRSFIDRFLHVTIKCNNLEAAEMTGLHGGEPFCKEEVFEALSALSRQTEKQVFVTCNAHGVAFSEGGKPRILPCVKQPFPIDVCGAGDACTAGMISALCAGGLPSEAAELGNLCAGVTVRKLGTTGTANQQEVLALFEEQEAEL